MEAFSLIVLVVSGGLIGFFVAVPIGPVNIICVRRTLHYGPLNGFISGLGSAVGDTIFAAISAFGLTAVQHLFESYSIFLQIVCAGLLIVFGAKTYFSDPIARHVEERRPVQEGEAADLAHAIVSTFALTITNPAPLFGFAAIFASLSGLSARMVSFTDTSLVVAGVLGGATAWWFLLSTVVGLLHARIDQRAMQSINHITGIVIGLFGLAVLGHLIFQRLV